MKDEKYIGRGMLLSICLMLFFSVFVLSGCGINPNSNKVDEHRVDEQGVERQSKIKVVATIFPLFDIVRIVGGENVDVILALPSGSSPHMYEIKPSQIKEMQGAEVFFSIGAGVDMWVEDIASAVDSSVVINLSKYVPLRPFDHQGHGQGDDDSFNTDPHYWLSPDNAEIIANMIALELGDRDNEHQADYQTRADNFIFNLRNREVEWQNKINELNDRQMVVLHDAWGYFADYFDLDIVATFEPFPGKAPSPKYIIGLQEAVMENNVKSLFVEPQLSKEAIKTMAQDLQVVTIGVLDPLGGVEGRDSYINLIDFNINSIYQALK